MTKEYLGENAVKDLFDIIDENYITREEIEKRDKSIINAINVSAALIATSILKLSQVIESVKGAEGGEDMENISIATDSEVDSVIDKYFGNNSETSIANNLLIESDTVTENSLNIANQEETNIVLNNYFN